MNGAKSLVVSVVTVASLMFGGLQYATSAFKALIPNIPNIDFPNKLPFKAVPKTSTVAPVSHQGGGVKAKNFVGGVGRVIPAIGGLWAGNEIANEYGDNLGGNMISQTPGGCYTESTTSSEKIHVPCSELKGGHK